jgi:surfeit locus 1 family protein
MTSEPPHFPVWLTVAVVIVFGVCFALGVWQLQRAMWKTHELAHIAALKNAPPRPIGPVLAAAAGGADASFSRVAADCAAGSAPAAYHLTTDNGDWIARARALCRLASGPFDGVLVDRGFLTASRGATNVPGVVLPAPVHVEGVLFRSAAPAPGLARPARYILVAERETPAPPGVTPAPFPDPASNLEYVGAYAPTWFGLAGAALAIYAAMLWRRYHPKR